MASLHYIPNNPAYGDVLAVGYSPASPTLVGHSLHLVVRSNASTVTDTGILGPGQVILDESKSVARGTAALRATFNLKGGTEWSAGGGDATLELLDGSLTVVDSATFTVEP